MKNTSLSIYIHVHLLRDFEEDSGLYSLPASFCRLHRLLVAGSDKCFCPMNASEKGVVWTRGGWVEALKSAVPLTLSILPHLPCMISMLKGSLYVS